LEEKMNFEIPSLVLADLTKKVYPIIDDKKNAIEAARFIKITAYGNGVSLQVLHEGASVQTYGEAKIFEEGTIGVSGKMLNDVVSIINTETVAFSLVEGRVKIQSGRRVMYLSILDADKFFPPPEFQYVDYKEVTDFFKTIEQVTHCTAEDDSRPLFKCICMRENSVACTDGRRLALLQTSFPLVVDITVSLQWLMQFKKVFTSAPVEIGVLGSFLYLRQGAVVGCVRLYVNKMPSFSKVIPVGAYDEAKMGRLELLEALKSAQVISSGEENAVALEFDNNELHINITTELGTMEDVVPCSFYKKFKGYYNVNYLVDALKKLRGDEVALTLRSNKNPLEITEGGFLQLIQPIQKS